MAEKKTKKKRDLVKDESPVRPVATRKRGENYAKPDRRDGHPWGGTGKGNPNHAHIPPEERCGRRKTNGEPCTALPVKGATVCRVHGGSAPQVMFAAMVRLQRASNKIVRALVTIALDEEEPTPVRLAAMREALDRAGIKSSEKVDVAHSVKPWEALEAKITRVPSERVTEETEARALDLDDDRC